MKLKVISTALAAAAIGFGLAACGSSGATTAAGVVTAPGLGRTSPAATTATTTTTATQTSTTATTSVTTPTSGALSKEPVFSVPTGAAPKKLEVKTIIAGNGPAAKDGDEISVNYVGKVYSTGKVFDASWKDTPGKAFGPFELGAGAVIPGWDEGLAGLKQGGRYELIIPPSLAYKQSTTETGIPPGSTLVFVVDLLRVTAK